MEAKTYKLKKDLSTSYDDAWTLFESWFKQTEQLKISICVVFEIIGNLNTV